MQTGSATAAAERMGITQPGISRLLASLEEKVGLKLFYRRRGRLEATREAYTLFPEIDQALTNVGRISSLAHKLKSSERGSLSIGVHPNKLIDLNLLSNFLNEHSRAKVTIHGGSGESVRRWILDNEVDCGLLEMPLDTTGLEFEPLFRTGAVCVLPRTHALAGRKFIDVKELNGENLVLIQKIGHFRQNLEHRFKEAKANMKVRLEVNATDAACTMAKRGMGIAVVSHALALPNVDNELVCIPLKPDIEHTYCFVTASAIPMDAMTKRFLEFCLEFFNHSRYKT